MDGTEVGINHKMFAEGFELPYEDITSFSRLPTKDFKNKKAMFSLTGVPFKPSSKKKEMKVEYRLLNDIVDNCKAQTLFVKAGSFDAVTRDRFLLMTAITFDVKVNWGSLLFGILKAMVTPGSRQEKCFAIQIGVLLQNVQGLVLGESKGFPKSRILDAKTVHRFVHINEKLDWTNLQPLQG
ncbi:pentatricopeptide repeat-containing protein mitochondrial [Dorcoceras hygrometricum]|uniref:Pentatricopeptide repeat-containing protein mitochondrial n=1 Tax=Dorcoceras hygrometricum TaxID=472368 RepID=A0A2Z7BE43_9LAMI|nr:pentatricopeptide repeat-containing protein mitochondrial [Dorcoceras hygrometricum]